MSLSTALFSAASGLAATSRAVQVASGNVANSQTPGYSVRSLQLTATNLGGSGAGVRVAAVTRQADPVLSDQLRMAGARRAEATERAAFWTAVEDAVGLPGTAGSLSDSLSRLTSALTLAVERPDLDSRLSAVERSAQDLVQKFRQVEDVIQQQRLSADATIAREVATLGQGLARLDAMNAQIVALRAGGHDSLDLEDARDSLLLNLSEIVPLKAHLHPDGRAFVYTGGGLVLLDRQPARLEFQASSAINAGLDLAGGGLSGLRINGRPVPTAEGGPMAGGRLSAAFALRDADGPAAQAALDAIAASLAFRLQDPVTDPTLTPGAPGLMTDSGGAVSSTPSPGLAGRLELSLLVQPGAGGALRALRDGLAAPTPGPMGNPAQLQRWLDALDRPIAPTPGDRMRSLSESVGEALSTFGQVRQSALDGRSRADALETALRDRQLGAGVDIDAEMQRLLEFETAYAANARVLRVVDEMIKRLLEI